MKATMTPVATTPPPRILGMIIRRLLPYFGVGCGCGAGMLVLLLLLPLLLLGGREFTVVLREKFQEKIAQP